MFIIRQAISEDDLAIKTILQGKGWAKEVELQGEEHTFIVETIASSAKSDEDERSVVGVVSLEMISSLGLLRKFVLKGVTDVDYIFKMMNQLLSFAVDLKCEAVYLVTPEPALFTPLGFQPVLESEIPSVIFKPISKLLDNGEAMIYKF